VTLTRSRGGRRGKRNLVRGGGGVFSVVLYFSTSITRRHMIRFLCRVTGKKKKGGGEKRIKKQGILEQSKLSVLATSKAIDRGQLGGITVHTG